MDVLKSYGESYTSFLRTREQEKTNFSQKNDFSQVVGGKKAGGLENSRRISWSLNFLGFVSLQSHWYCFVAQICVNEKWARRSLEQLAQG